MKHRTTVIEISIEPTKLFEIVQSWAQQWNFSAYEEHRNRVVYYKRVRLAKAWLSVENRDGKGEIEAWMASPNLGPDFEGNIWRGWKTALPQGFGMGPQHIYRKIFNDLLKQIDEQCPNIISSETVNTKSSSVKASTNPPLAPVLAVYGIFLIIAGAISLFSGASLIYTNSFLKLATDMLISSIFNIVVGSLIFASSRAMIKGKVLAIWLYGLSVLVEVSSQLITGEKVNYLFILFSIYALWNIHKETKQQTATLLAASD